MHVADVQVARAGNREINYPNIFRKLGPTGLNGYVPWNSYPKLNLAH